MCIVGHNANNLRGSQLRTITIIKVCAKKIILNIKDHLVKFLALNTWLPEIAVELDLMITASRDCYGFKSLMYDQLN